MPNRPRRQGGWLRMSTIERDNADEKRAEDIATRRIIKGNKNYYLRLFLDSSRDLDAHNVHKRKSQRKWQLNQTQGTTER